MRIISGTHKGRRLMAPSTLPVRPTTDRAKESLFNIIQNRYYFEEKNMFGEGIALQGFESNTKLLRQPRIY